MAYLHFALRALLVRKLQSISECHRGNSLIGYRESTDWPDLGDLGNQTLTSRIKCYLFFCFRPAILRSFRPEKTRQL